MSNIPEGARDEVEKLMGTIAVAVDSWSSSMDRSEEFKTGVTLSALCSSLVLWSVFHEVSAEAVIHSVISTLHANGALGDDDDDEVVH